MDQQPKRKRERAPKVGRRKKALRPYIPPARIEPVSVERAVDEGLLIAKSSIAMDAKNKIIVDTLRDGADFDPATIADFVEDALRDLALDYLAHRRRMDRLAIASISAVGPQTSGHDYRPEDYKALTQRGIVFSKMSAELDRYALDAAVVAEIVESARAKAWAEVGMTITARLDIVGHAATDPDYGLQRQARMALVREVDLAAWSSDHRA